MISENMAEALIAVRDRSLVKERAVDHLAAMLGIPWKVALRRLEKAESNGWLDYGVSIDWCWLTQAGTTALNEYLEAHRHE